MAWTEPPWNDEYPARRQQPRTGWSALLSAAVRWPGRWFTKWRFLWLLGVVLSASVLWLAGSHLGPALRAAHGQGIQGEWTAQEHQDQWYGEFVSTSGTVTLAHVYYAGSLSAVQAGTTVPALDTGAGDEVYPLTGSSKWIHDAIGTVVAALALIALLARAFFVTRRRRRARRADGFTAGTLQEHGFAQGMLPGHGSAQGMLSGRKRLLRRGAPRSRAGQLAGVAVGVAAMGFLTVRCIALLADVRPYTGWYWLLAVAGGIVIAVALPWALIRGARSQARWLAWLLIGYIAALGAGMRYCLSLRFTPPSAGQTVAPPSTWLVLGIAGLSAVTLTAAAITLLILVSGAAIIAPGPVGRWLRGLRSRRAGANRPSGTADERSAGGPPANW